MTEPGIVDGSVPFKIGRREYMLAPLNLKGVKRAMVIQRTPIDPATPEQGIDHGVEILLLSLRRNHPEVTADELLEEIDGNNLQSIVDQVMLVAGASPKAPGETEATPS